MQKIVYFFIYKNDLFRVYLIRAVYFTLPLFVLGGFYTGPFHEQDPGSFEPYSEHIPGMEQAIEMTPVPGGIFTMGSPGNKGLFHKVRVNSFWMGVYEITWGQYDLFVKEEIDNLKNQVPATGGIAIEADAVSLPTPPYVDMSFGMGKDGYPAVNMTHYAAVMFTKWLTARTGKFYRLPTEAEWEYACKAGGKTAYHFGDNPDELDTYAWYKGNSNRTYHKTGTKKPNSRGIYDMHGNVAEWTMDQYVEDYYFRLEGEVADNPWVRPEKLYSRSIRGGSWMHEPAELRCTERQGSKPGWKRRDPQLPKSRWWFTDAPFLGFRVVRPKDQPSRKEMERYWLKAIDDY